MKSVLVLGIIFLFIFSACNSDNISGDAKKVIEKTPRNVKEPVPEPASLTGIISEYVTTEGQIVTSTLPLDEALRKKNETNSSAMYVAGEIIVKYKKDVDGGNKAASILSKDVTATKVFKQKNNYYKLKVNMDVRAAANILSNDPDVEYAEPNYVYFIDTIPNDPRYAEQWALPAVNAEQAWSISEGSPETIIAIVDTGVAWAHSDLMNNIWVNDDPENGIDDDGNGFVDDLRGYDFVNLEEFGLEAYCYPGEDCLQEDNNPNDFHSHGTHCAGIAAAEKDNNIGISGLCPDCTIMPVRAGVAVQGELGQMSGTLLNADIAQAIYYATDNGANVISMSFGGSSSSELYQEALDYAAQHDVVLIAAAGNDGSSSLYYPASYENVIAVIATDINEDKADFSNFGAWTDISAPGVNILSTIPENSYTSYSGTSMATPLVAGLAGLILSEHPEYTAEEVRSALRAGAKDLFLSGYEEISSHGLIQADAALTHANVISLLSLPEYNPTINNDFAIIGSAKANQFSQYVLDYQLHKELCIDSDGGSEPFIAGWMYKPGIYFEDYCHASINMNEGVCTGPNENYIDSYRCEIGCEGGRCISNDDYLYCTDTDGGDERYYYGEVTYQAAGAEPVTLRDECYFGTQLREQYCNGNTPEHKTYFCECSGNLDVCLQPSTVSTITIPTDDWPVIQTSQSPVDNAQLGLFDPPVAHEQPAYIRLRVTDSNIINTQVLPVVINTVDIVTPAWNDFTNKKQVPIVGSASGSDFASYVLEYKTRENPNEWVVFANSSKPVVNGTLGVLDVGNNNLRGVIEIRLNTFTVQGTNVSESTAIIYDPRVRTGWPVFEDSGVQSVSFADINNDGREELITVTSGSYEYQPVMRARTLAGVELWREWVWYYTKGVTAGDVDGDSSPEIVLTVKSWDETGTPVFVYEADGTLKPGWPKNYTGRGFGQATLFDITGDSVKDILLPHQERELIALTGAGTELWAVNNQKYNYQAHEGHVAVGDIDGNGVVESVLVVQDIIAYYSDAFNSYILAVSKTGVVTELVSLVNESVRTRPILSDVNNDGLEEIMLVTTRIRYPYENKLYLFDNNGNILHGWPVILPSGSGYTTLIPQTPSVADVDNNGDLELFIDDGAGLLHAFHHDATYVRGWPINHSSIGDITNQPLLADIDNDRGIEVIVMRKPCELVAYNLDGSMADGFPIPLSVKEPRIPRYPEEVIPADCGVYESHLVSLEPGKTDLVLNLQVTGINTPPIPMLVLFTFPTVNTFWPMQGFDVDKTNKFTKHSCFEGTTLSTCASKQPKYCSADGVLSDNCGICGCPNGLACQTDGLCVEIPPEKPKPTIQP